MRYSISKKDHGIIKEGLAEVEVLSQDSMMSPLYTSDDVINTPYIITLTSLLYIEKEGFYAFRIRSNNPDPSVHVNSSIPITHSFHSSSRFLLTTRLTSSLSQSTALLCTIAGSFQQDMRQRRSAPSTSFYQATVISTSSSPPPIHSTVVFIWSGSLPRLPSSSPSLPLSSTRPSRL